MDLLCLPTPLAHGHPAARRVMRVEFNLQLASRNKFLEGVDERWHLVSGRAKDMFFTARVSRKAE